MSGTGLRERKKQATRERITAVAIELFAESGFEKVPVTEIAARADVSPATVFNYFPTKEDLVYEGMTSFNATTLAAVRDRPDGVSVVAAFREHVLQPRGVLADPSSPMVESVGRLARIVGDSRSLQARERLEADHAARELRELLADELGHDDLRAWAVAASLVAVTRGMSHRVQRAAAEGRLTKAFARRLLAEASDAIALVEQALAAR